MSPRKEIQVSTLDLYNSLKPVKASWLAPRKGYYLIKKVELKHIPNHSAKVEVATALWKFHYEEEFQPKNQVEVQLETFRKNSFSGSEDLLNNLIDQVISVRMCFVDTSKSTKGTIVCHWGNAWQTVSPVKEDIALSKTVEKQLESDEDVANSLLDQYESEEDWDNYEMNLHLDIEEAKMIDDTDTFEEHTF